MFKKTSVIGLYILLFTVCALTWVAYVQELISYLDPAASLMFDDSFMFIRYAKIWLAGYGEAWNMGEPPAYGNTSQLHFLWVLLLTANLNVPIEILAALASALPALIVLIWLPYFSARHSALFLHRSIYWKYLFWLSVLTPLLYWNSPWAYHSGTGMDAMLSLLMHLWLIDAVLSYVKRKRNGYLVASCILAYLCYLTRPDNLLAAFLFPVLYLGLVARWYRQALIFAVVLAGMVVVDAGVKYLYFGDYFPLAYYSKRIGFLENYGYMGEIYNSPFRTFFIFLLAILPFLAVLIFSIRRSNGVSMAVFLFPAAITIAYYFTMVAVMNYGGRYFFPFIPYFIAAAVLHTEDLSWVKMRRAEWALRIFGVVAVSVLFFQGDKYNYQIAKFFLQESQEICDDSNLGSSPVELRRYMGAQSNRHLSDVLEEMPQGIKIAMSEHGYVGARNPQVNIIDLAGLHNHHLAHVGFSPEWLFSQKPDAIWAGHWQYTCLNTSIFDSKEFWDHYVLYPHLFSWGFALRKDSPYYEQLHSRIETIWPTLYPGLEMRDYLRTQPLENVDYSGNQQKVAAFEEKVRLRNQAQ